MACNKVQVLPKAPLMVVTAVLDFWLMVICGARDSSTRPHPRWHHALFRDVFAASRLRGFAKSNMYSWADCQCSSPKVLRKSTGFVYQDGWHPHPGDHRVVMRCGCRRDGRR